MNTQQRHIRTSGICHFRDERRKIGRTFAGGRKQVPTICEVDVIVVTEGGDSWTDAPDLVTCPDCLSRLGEMTDGS